MNLKRLRSLLGGDIRFQLKYGFYFIYLLLTILYAGVLIALPQEWRAKASILMVFSDPAAMGLYFMGAIVFLEKSERVLDSLAVSPVLTMEYVLSKLTSIGLISVLVAVILMLVSGVLFAPGYLIAGVFLCSCLFSAVGLMVATRSPTLNAFVLGTIPAEIVINVPAFAYLFGYRPVWMLVHPGVSMIELCENGRYAPLCLFILLGWTVLAVLFANNSVRRMFTEAGGFKL